MNTVLCFGELLWDLFPAGPQLGGAPANFAFRIQSLGHRAVLASAVGNDELGERALQQLRRNGLETAFVQTHPTLPTGTVEIALRDGGEPDYHIVPGVAYDEIQPSEELNRLAQTADCLCFGTLVQRSPASRATLHELLAHAGPALKVLDLNLRKECYSKETVWLSLEQADLLKLNEAEVSKISMMFSLPSALPDFARLACERWDLRVCVVTRGVEGVYALGRTGEECTLPGLPVQVVDACGAGDAFTAGFVSRFLAGAPLRECCAYGNALGAAVAATAGATAAISPERIKELLRQARLG